MANFNSSFWYHLYVNTNKSRSLAGTSLYSQNGTLGAVIYKGVAKQNATQRWQWFGVNSTYVLRSEDGGPEAFMGTKYEPHEKTPGQTQALMIRNNISDDSIYWTVSPWGDGTFFMTNTQNGTDWHLEKRPSGSIALSSNITAPQNGQRWSFEAIEEINNDKFSTIDLPSQSTSTPPTNSNPPDASQSTDSSSPSASTGLSTGAKAGIGAGVGCLALVALIGLVFFLLRRKKQKRDTPNPYANEQKNETVAGGHEIGGAGKYELGNEEARHEIAHGKSIKYGHHGVTSELEGDLRGEEPTYELSGAQAGEQRAGELPSSPVPGPVRR